MEDGSGHTESRVDKIEIHDSRGLGQGVGRQAKDNEGEDVGRP